MLLNPEKKIQRRLHCAEVTRSKNLIKLCGHRISRRR
jgi:hypothetical protein